MFRKIATITLTFAAMLTSITAQNTWSLEKCVQYARENSLNVKQAQFGINLAELSQQQAKLSRLPSLNSSMSGGWQFGRTIDPTTNQFRTDNTFAGRIGVDAGMILYSGNSINNSVKQSKLDLQAANLDAQAVANDLSLQIAQAYLNILLAKEQLENARQRIELSRQQLEITNKQIQAGTVPENQRLDFVAQIARDEQVAIESANQVEINLLNLKNLLELDPTAEFNIEEPGDIDLSDLGDPSIYQFSELYQIATGTQPQIDAGEVRLESARLQEKIAKSSMLPTVRLFGNVSTNYSSLAVDFTNPNFNDAMLVPNNPEPVLINGETAEFVDFSLEGVTFPNQPFSSQINENFGQSVGMSISVPIYNNHINRLNVERARLQVLNQQVSNLQATQQLKTNVQTAIANAKASKQNLAAARRALEASQVAYDNAQKRYDLGAINSLEYITARNNLDQAQVTLTQAKYQYLFDLKVVDFYLGKELTLE